MANKKVLVAVNEPGSANALAPVLAQLRKQGIYMNIYASKAAAPCLDRYQLASLPLEDLGNGSTVLGLSNYGLVVVGTSLEASIERYLVRVARSRGIPTMTVLDHWTNYWQRFTDPETGVPLDSLPDTIAVMDEQARQDMIDLGIPCERLVVTGQPYLEQLSQQPPLLSSEEVRRELQVPDGSLLVTFVSEVRAYHPAASPGPVDLPTEQEIVTAIDWVAQGLQDLPERSPFLVLKAHPLEGPGLMEAQARKLQDTLPALPVTSMDGRSLVAASSVVVGLTSMLLLESAYLGIPTLSVRPAGREQDCFIGRRMGLMESAYSLEETGTALRKLASAPISVPLDHSRLVAHQGATENVLQLINTVLGRGQGVPLTDASGRP